MTRVVEVKLVSTNVYRRGEFRELEVGIDEGRIVKVGSNLGSAREEIDLGDSLLLPGIIDGHVHFRDPGNTEKEDFRSGSEAAVRGGVTTVVDMPNNDPPIKTPDLFKQKKRIASEKSLVNFALYAGIPEDLELVEPLWREGAVGFKLYFAQETVDLGTLANEIDDLGALLTVHAEDKELIGGKPRPKTPEEYLDSRPAEAEIAAVKKLVGAAPERLHLAHVTLPESVSILGDAATLEVTPHHLLIAREDLDLSNFVPVCNPPIRGRSEVEGIQERLNSGDIDMIASDHAPHEKHEKTTADPEEGSAGIPGVETILPLSLTYARNNDIPLGSVIDRLTKVPARLFGFDRRGEIREGFRADLTVVDETVDGKIRGEEFYSRAKLTPFEGYEVSYTPRMTFVNGELKYREGELVDKTPGSFLRGGGNGKR